MIKKIDWTSPPAVLFIISVLGVLAPIVPFMRNEDSFSIAWPFAFYDIQRTVFKVVVIYSAIFLIFLLTYLRASTNPIRSKYYALDDSSFAMRFCLVLGIALGAFALVVYSVGGFSSLLQGASDRTRAFAGIQGLFFLINMLLSLVIIWLVRLLQRRTSMTEKVTFFAYSIVAFGISALQGQKSTLFIAIVAVGVIFNNRIKRISLPFIILGSSFLFIALMFYHAYKQEYLVLGRFVTLSSGSQFWSSVYDFMRFQFFGNFMELQTMGVLVEGMPIPMPYQYGWTYWAGVTLLVPRSWYPDKPLPSTGIFTEAYWPGMYLQQGTSLPAGVFGEAYMNFSLVGVAAMAVLFGWFYGRLRARVSGNSNDHLMLIYYAVAVASLLHFFRGELAAVFYTAASIALPARFFVRKIER